MTSCGSSQGAVERTAKVPLEPLDPSGGKERQYPGFFGRKFSRGNSSFDSGSEIEADDDALLDRGHKCITKVRTPSHAKKYRKLNLYRRATAAGDGSGDLADGGKSYLFSLLSTKRVVAEYANNLLRTQDKDNPTSGQERGEGNTDATPATAVKGNTIPPGTNDNVSSDAVRGLSSGISGRGSFRSKSLTDDQMEEAENLSKGIRLLQESFSDYSHLMRKFPIEIRMKNICFSVPYTKASSKITTVYNSSFVYKIIKKLKQFTNVSEEMKEVGVDQTKLILDNISLCLKPGKMYLVLGPPGCGKSTLLKAIAGRLYHNSKEDLRGSVTYNGKELYDSRGFYDRPDMYHENSISFIDQLDRHAPLYTVEETFNFAFQCKHHNGRHIDFRFEDATPENQKLAKKADDGILFVNTFMKILDIDHVRDTFVGNDMIRGISGGQRRRVTIGEMLMSDSPVICGDEISNGLDASSTFEIITAMSYIGKAREKLQVISLLQPSPETVSLFDEIILMANGKILYAGPVMKVESYFASLGYMAPIHMDIGNFLQLISTPDGAKLYDPPPDVADVKPNPYSLDELAEEFCKSRLGKRVSLHLKEPIRHTWTSSLSVIPASRYPEEPEFLDDRKYEAKYQNNFFFCFWLNLKRQITLWRRDKRVLITNAVKNSIMGISVGGVFYQTTDAISILGVLFQAMLFVMLGGMVTAPTFVTERLIYYKHSDANYFGAFSFVFAKAVSRLPQTAIDCTVFGTILYYMVGLAPQPIFFFSFLGIVFVFNILMSEFLFIVSTFATTTSVVQIASACVVFLFLLFCGFLIPPVTIPSYFRWIYWYNPLAWAYRALVVNAFRNYEYDPVVADEILKRFGFVYNDNQPFDREWIAWAYIFMSGHVFLSLAVSSLVLATVRVRSTPLPSFESVEELGEIFCELSENIDTRDSHRVNIPFKPITLSFENVCYDVNASTRDENIRLLHDINGHFRAGRMCALMGESGAGKTTLMDVIALRKNSGKISGDIRINGFPQEKLSFRRCSGYVEQFDIQSPQLTVRETVLFSARLRLNCQKVRTDGEKEQFCDSVIKTLELAPLAHCLVGDDEKGGLSFGQKKRLSIAVELAASPSILFLDEPTTGLDARGASLVVKILRKIADQGRTVCATVHQPSSAVFHMFDDLLLLKKGGHLAYFGELGFQSEILIKYFEGQGAKKIKSGDNPANWMLRVLQDGKDYSKIYKRNLEYSKLKHQVAAAKVNPPEELEITYFENTSECQKLTNRRLKTIYWRSPAYNLSRLTVCGVIALILGSVFLTENKVEILTENQVTAYFSITFISFIIIGILSITTVLPVMLAIRNVFYKQLAAGMIDNAALGWALGVAEMGFIVSASFIFCLIYLAVSRTFPMTFFRIFKFWGFFTFNIAIYSYFGQAFMCLVPTMATAQILCSVFIGLNNFFSGFIVRPQFMYNIFFFTHWITPGHFVYEGLILSQYWDDQRRVRANSGSEFFLWLGCNLGETCEGSVQEYIWVFFGKKFNEGNLIQDVLVLGLFLVLARVLTFLALRKFQYTYS